ncbi:MAG: sodium:calcium antiporter [Bacteroidota bacterium]
MEIIIALIIIVVTSFVIWKSGEGFESAADYLGRNLSNGVKGATINAIGSSLPELLTTIFFLFILRNSQGFAAGLGTTAGSAVFNVAIIPFIVGMSVYFKFKKSELSFSRKVIVRDGIALIIVNVLLIIMVKSGVLDGYSLSWIEGAALMGFYLLYLIYLFATMDKKDTECLEEQITDKAEIPSRRKREIFASFWKFNFEQAFVGHGSINNTRAWLLLLFSMAMMSAACYGLAEASIMLGDSLGIPIFIVSVVIAAAATSVPDTFLSYKDASKGNYDDSISNAFGSNVFDIGFAVGFPVLLFGLIFGEINLETEVQRDISELLVLLLFITVAVFLIFISGNKLSISKVIVVFLLYLLFLFVVLSKVFQIGIVNDVSDFLYKISEYFTI